MAQPPGGTARLWLKPGQPPLPLVLPMASCSRWLRGPLPLLLLSLLMCGCRPQLVQAPPQPSQPQAPSGPCQAGDRSPEQLFREGQRGVAVVSTPAGTGSAFVVRHQNGDTLLITNAHVVAGTRVVTLKWADGTQDQASVLRSGDADTPQSDLALLQVPGQRGVPLLLKTARPSVGADVVAIGAPKGLEFSLTRGVLSSLRDDGDILQIDAPINPGNSGGPVLDRSGCVVGVATFKLSDSEGLNFAVAASVVEHFLLHPIGRRPDEPAPAPVPQDPAGEVATCWFQMEPGASALQGSRCRVSSRRNANGHTVFDVEEPGGLVRSVLLWGDHSAEVLINGERFEGQWQEDADGDVRVQVGDGVFAFRYPD